MSYSEKICKICNVKPIIINDCDLNEIEIYPNFNDSENLIKLLDLKIGDNTLFYLLQIYSYLDRCKDSLKEIYRILIDSDFSSELKEEIKTKIKRSKWKYE